MPDFLDTSKLNASFPFTITFSPRDENESALVKEIIRRLKQSMAPKVGDMRAGAAGGIFLKSPDVFQLKYLKENCAYLHHHLRFDLHL